MQGANPVKTVFSTDIHAVCSVTPSFNGVPCMLKRGTRENRLYFITTGAPALTSDAYLYRLRVHQILLLADGAVSAEEWEA